MFHRFSVFRGFSQIPVLGNWNGDPATRDRGSSTAGNRYVGTSHLTLGSESGAVFSFSFFLADIDIKLQNTKTPEHGRRKRDYHR